MLKNLNLILCVYDYSTHLSYFLFVHVCSFCVFFQVHSIESNVPIVVSV